jgi:hypothetical protein
MPHNSPLMLPVCNLSSHTWLVSRFIACQQLKAEGESKKNKNRESTKSLTTLESF